MHGYGTFGNSTSIQHISAHLTQNKSKGRLHQRYLNRQLVNLRLTLSGY